MKKISLFLMALFVSVSAMADITETINLSSGYENAQLLTNVDGENVSLLFDKSTGNTAPAWYTTGAAARLYGQNTLTITAKGGFLISKIEFTFVTGKDVPSADNSTFSNGSYDYATSIWTATDAKGVFDMVVKNTNANGHFRIQKIMVTLKEAVGVSVYAPEFSVAGGLQEKAFDLELTCSTDGADIYYTLNGGAETKYTSAINISTTTKVKAWAVKGADKSREVETTYYFNEYIENATIEQFLAAEVSSYKWYKLTGTIANLDQEKLDYGNFDLVDETGSVYVYGLTATKQSYNDKSFPTLGLKDGDKITIWGTRADFKGTAQVGGPAYMAEYNIEYTDVANIQEFIAKADSTGYTRITGTVNVTVQNKKQVYVQDATGALVIYGATTTYETGDALTGIIGKFKDYKGTPEMEYPIFPETVEAGTVTPKSVLLKDVNAALVSHYIKVVGEVAEDVTFVTDSASNMTLRDAAGNTVIARNKFKFAAEFFEEDLIEVTAVVDLFNGEPQLGVISYDWADEFPVAVENVYINNIYTENGLVVADGEFAIFTIIGQDVTAMNGRLENGIYIVKTAKSAVKVVVK